MSNLLEKASLVMIPSGYKEDVVYSEIPLDGSGDMAFTRSSNGTRVNSAGLVEVVPWNLAQQSETFGVSPWTTSTLSITTNATTAPNGTTTAAKLMVSTANTPHQVQQSFNNENANHTVFIYAKKSELNFVQLALGNSTEQYANFNLNTGVVGTKGTYCASSSIESVGNGWYKCSAYFNQGTIPSLMVYVTNSASSDWGGVVSYSGANNTDGIFVWGYQLNIGSTAKPYFPTTDRLNVPRLTYQNGGGGCPSLLLEKQSTNVVTYSEQFDNAVWLIAGSITVTANATTSPDGTQNADLFSHGSSSNYTYQNLGVLSGTITTSIFVKKGSQSSIAFGFVAGSYTGGMSVIFDFDTQTFGTPTNYSNFTSISATYESYGNGWYRLNLTGTTATSTGYYYVLGSLLDSFAVNAYLWGAQVEASSYPTSYIPTTSSSATRVADACLTASVPSLIGQSEGVLFIDFNRNNSSASSWFSISNIAGTSSNSYENSVYFFQIPNDIFVAEVWASNVKQVGFSLSGLSVGRHKIALGYKANDFVLYVDGVQQGTDTSGSVPAMNYLTIGGAVDGGAQQTQLVNQSLLFKTRLTNAELASLTTI